MAKQIINAGARSNDGTGDSLRDGARKINENFSEIYSLLGDGETLSVVSRINVGQGLAISNPTGAVLITGKVASSNDLGLVKIGANLSIAPDGTLNAVQTEYQLPTASNTVLGGVKVGTGLSINQGVLSSNNPTPYALPIASNSTLGGIKIGSGLTVAPDGTVSGTASYSLPTATDSVLGGIKIGAGLSISNGVVSVTNTTNSSDRLVNGSQELILDGDGILTFPGGSTFGDNILTGSVGSDLAIVTDDGEISNQWTFRQTGTLSLPPGGGLTVQDGGIPIILDQVNWAFDSVGQLNQSSSLYPKSFTAVLDIEHLVNAGGVTLIGNVWQFLVSFVAEANSDVTIEIANNVPFVSNPGYTNGLQFSFTEADHGIPGYIFQMELDNITNVPAGWTVNLIPGNQPSYPSTLASVNGPLKLTAVEQSWVFGVDRSLTLPGDGVELKVGGAMAPSELHLTLPGTGGGSGPLLFRFTDEVGEGAIRFPNGTYTNGNQISASTDDTIELKTFYRQTISAEAITGSSQDLLVVDISENDDITVLDTNWEINAGSEVAPIWLSVVSTDIVPGDTCSINVPDFEFVAGFTYTFRNSNPTAYDWTFNALGTLTAPGGAILSNETQAINNTYVTYNLSSPSRFNKVYWEAAEQPMLFFGVATDTADPLFIVAMQLKAELEAFGVIASRTISFTTLGGTTHSATFPQYSNIQSQMSITELGSVPGISWLMQDWTWGVNGAPATDTIIDITSLSFSEAGTYRDFAIELPSQNGVDELRWDFNNNGTTVFPGSLEFGDGSVQTTAYTGTNTSVAKTGIASNVGTATGLVDSTWPDPIVDGNYGPFTLGVVTFTVVVTSGVAAYTVVSTTGTSIVGQIIGNLNVSDLGGTPGNSSPIIVTSVNQAFTPIDLTKSINKLTSGNYTLANGAEGQILYLVPQTGTTDGGISIIIANARVLDDGGTPVATVYTAIDYRPFVPSTGSPIANVVTLIFTDGAWQASSGSFD